MCGIAGMLGGQLNDRTARAMLETMNRRGPDGRGIFRQEDITLLHSRLAIIDPQGGSQPMGLDWQNERYVITYNGELYNTEELRRELLKLGHTFCGHSDTEVLLHGYAQWGEEILEKSNGIFAFAIWECREKRLFIARDRIGVKPFFYTCKDGAFIFASEIKTLLAHPAIRGELDAEGAAQLLLLGPGRMPGSGVLRNIRELEPGCCGYYQTGKLRIRRYWYLKDRTFCDTFEETVEKVAFLVTDAIRAQMVSDVPVGTFLSGGLDSSLISAVCADAMGQRGERLQTFSVDYENNDRFFRANKFQPDSDSWYIRRMQQKINSDHHWSVLTPENLMDVLEEATVARDLPGMADVDFSLLSFCGDIRKEVKVALSGECADEIFGGYPWYRDPEIRDAEGFPWAQNTAQRAALLSPQLAAKLKPEEYVLDAWQDTCRSSDILPENSPQEKRMKQMVNLNFRWFMQTLLDRKDRMSMYHSLEVRVPFCDYRIAEYLYAVPWEYKDHRGKEKGLLRQAMASWLPEEVLWRKKSPYPKTMDPKYEMLVRDKLQNVLDDPSAPLFALADRKAVESLITGESVWPWYGQLMRRPQTMAYFLQLDYWLRRYNVNILL